MLHHRATLAAARAGKHVIIEKPLCVTLEEADEMIAVCREHGRKLMYAEELCFAPKYERVRHLVKEGAVGDIYMLKQLEKHSGPHSDWFWNVDQSGGGVLMDMGCHAFGWFRWMLGGDAGRQERVGDDGHGAPQGPHPRRGQRRLRRRVRERRDRLGRGQLGEAGRHGRSHRGLRHRRASSFADLFRGNAASTYSEEGYGYAAEKAGSTKGWTFTIFEEVFNQGYPHELQHFIRCVRENEKPLVTGEDGRAVLEMIYAAYASARSGAKVALPFQARRPQAGGPVERSDRRAGVVRLLRGGSPESWAATVAGLFIERLKAQSGAAGVPADRPHARADLRPGCRGSGRG